MHTLRWVPHNQECSGTSFCFPPLPGIKHHEAFAAAKGAVEGEAAAAATAAAAPRASGRVHAWDRLGDPVVSTRPPGWAPANSLAPLQPIHLSLHSNAAHPLPTNRPRPPALYRNAAACYGACVARSGAHHACAGRQHRDLPACGLAARRRAVASALRERNSRANSLRPALPFPMRAPPAPQRPSRSGSTASRRVSPAGRRLLRPTAAASNQLHFRGTPHTASVWARPRRRHGVLKCQPARLPPARLRPLRARPHAHPGFAAPSPHAFCRPGLIKSPASGELSQHPEMEKASKEVRAPLQSVCLV